MASAYNSEPWHDFFVGVAGASAALAGLLFVSLSINLQHILGHAWLPRRAALTVMLLFETLVLAVLGLVPGSRRRRWAWSTWVWAWACGSAPAANAGVVARR